MEASAILFTGVDQVTVGTVGIPEPGPGEVLIKAAYTCISPGTELRSLSGKQEGSEHVPFIPGYSMSGTVVACGPETTLREGTPVFCAGTSQVLSAHRLWGGHSSYAVCAEKSVHVLPDGCDLLQASIAKPAAITYHGVRISRPQLSDRVAVLGLGLIGQLAARLHTLSGANVVAADLSPSRVEVAQRAGVQALTIENDLLTTFQRVFPDGVDLIVDATGNPAVLAQAVELAHSVTWNDDLVPGARYLIQGSYPDTFAVPYQRAFERELSFLLTRDNQPRDTFAVLKLIANGRLLVSDLLTVRKPEEAAQTYKELRDPHSGLLTATFAW